MSRRGFNRRTPPIDRGLNLPTSKDADGWPSPDEDPPDDTVLERMVLGSINTTSTDGCHVEPDGICPHGHPSWLRKLGIV